jgi:hypothetical protein
MNLQQNEVKIFFKNWLGLLAFVNDKHNLVKGFGHPKKPLGLKIDNITILKTKLWENVGIIDEYINEEKKLSKYDIQILKGWKDKVNGPFMVVRHLKKYSVFMNEKKLYGVIGISNPISEMMPDNMLPIMVKTVLLPFNSQIIYDSTFGVDNVEIGPNMRKSFNESYSEIKKKKGIISTLSIV